MSTRAAPQAIPLDVTVRRARPGKKVQLFDAVAHGHRAKVRTLP